MTAASDTQPRRTGPHSQPTPPVALPPFDLAGAAPHAAVPRVRRVLPDTGRDEQGNLITPAQMRAAHKDSAKYRVENFPANVTGKDTCATPPAHQKVWPGQVAQVLAGMAPMLDNDPQRFLPAAATKLSPGYEDYGFKSRYDSRFKTGVLLNQAGCERVARHFARKYEAHIQFHDESSQRAADRLPALFESWRSITPGQDVRRAHCFDVARKDGRNENHASLVVYIREGGQEALMLCDSTHKDGDLELGTALAKACERHAARGNPIAVYQHVWCVQHDEQSCWVFALKAAAALTGQRRDAPAGQQADAPTVNFIRPNLLGALNERRVGPAPAGVIAVWSLPELARMGQSLDTIAAHAGPEIDQLLAGKSKTLRDDLEQYSYMTPSGQVIPDYLREKGERLAELSDILEWSERISAHVGPENWNDEREGEFVRQMTRLVRGDQYVPTVDDRIEELSEFLAKPPSTFVTQETHRDRFIELAKAAHSELVGMDGKEGAQGALLRLPDAESLTELIPQLSPAGLDELCRYLEMTVDRLQAFAMAMKDGARKFNADATPAPRSRYDYYSSPPDFGPIARGARDRLSHLLGQQEEILTQVQCEQKFRQLLTVNADKAIVADAIAALPVGDIDAFKEAVVLALRSIDGLAPISLGANEQDEDEQDEDARADELFLHEQLLIRLKDRCEQQQVLLRPKEVDSDDDESDDDEAAGIDAGGGARTDDAGVAESNAAAGEWLERIKKEIGDRVGALSDW